eukprot:scaffold7141_cov26-Phaeocystis_antarctica.AAC.2
MPLLLQGQEGRGCACSETPEPARRERRGEHRADRAKSHRVRHHHEPLQPPTQQGASGASAAAAAQHVPRDRGAVDTLLPPREAWRRGTNGVG